MACLNNAVNSQQLRTKDGKNESLIFVLMDDNEYTCNPSGVFVIKKRQAAERLIKKRDGKGPDVKVACLCLEINRKAVMEV